MCLLNCQSSRRNAPLHVVIPLPVSTGKGDCMNQTQDVKTYHVTENGEVYLRLNHLPVKKLGHIASLLREARLKHNTAREVEAWWFRALASEEFLPTFIPPKEEKKIEMRKR